MSGQNFGSFQLYYKEPLFQTHNLAIIQKPVVMPWVVKYHKTNKYV